MILLVFFSGSHVFAGAIEKCIDSTGKITYTDKGCKQKETAQDTYVSNSVKKSKNTNTGKTTLVSYKVTEIGLLTDQAAEQCSKHAIKYFTDSHADVDRHASSEFLQIKDRSIKGAGVKIVLEGVVRYKANKKPKEMKLLCTANKSRESDWELAFKDAE